MPISPYIRHLRARVGSMRLLVPSVTALVYDEAGRILLVRQRDGGVWSTPGGSLEPGETPADAVVREAWEETGLRVEPVRIAGVYGGADFVVRYPNGDETEYLMCVFECAVRSGQLRADGDETLEARFWSREEARGLALSNWLRTVLETFYDRTPEAHFHPPRRTPPGANDEG